jgi:hypothetical protein
MDRETAVKKARRFVRPVRQVVRGGRAYLALSIALEHRAAIGPPETR